MRKVSIIASAAVLLFTGGMAAMAQNYSNAVVSLKPVGYWPLNETVAPPQPLNLTAYNLGTLGAAANGTYGAWYQPSGTTWYLTNNIMQTQAFTYPYDGSMAMVCTGAPGQYVIIPRNTNAVANNSITLNPPFSIEAWLKVGTNGSQLGSIVSQGGYANLNFGGPNPTNPFYGGLGTGWAGVEVGQFQDYFFITCQCTNGTSKNNELDTSGYNKFVGFKVGQWVHLVATFDGTTEAIWTNGALCVSKTIPNNGAGIKYIADPTSPLMIGNGSVPPSSYGQGYAGVIHDVAIYNTVLSQTSIQNHFQTANGTNATYGHVYTNAVLADSPILYYRLNDAQSQVNAGYPSGTFPVANNYGSLGTTANGVYQPGTTPGVAGPTYAGFGANSKAVAFNGWLGSVDVGGGALPSNLNPTGRVPLTVAAWFQTGPADAPARFEEILGHGDSSYRLALGQAAGENHFNAGPGPELQFTSPQDVITNSFALNDGAWHMAAGVSDGTNEYLYLDGVLAKSNNTPTGINIVGNANDLLIGGDSEYTYAFFNGAGTANTIRTFDGQVAHVAFWTNALSSSQIQQLYGAAAVPPYIVTEPLASYTLNAGQNLTVPAVVRGSLPTYQWYQNNSPVSGQTNSSLSYTPAGTGNSGTYYLVATGSGSSVTSSIVNVTVYGAPTVAQQTPAQLDIFAGSSPTLNVTALGAAPIHYQWSLNSTVIAGATNASYTLTNLQSSGTYSCAMTNFVGTGAITPIAVTVLADPTAPYPVNVLGDGPVAYFRLDEASGTTAYDYVGGNNATYYNVTLGNAGYDSLQSVQADPNETSAGFGFDSPPNDYAGNVPTYLNFGTPSGGNAEFSVEAWVVDDFASNSNGIVALGYGNGGEQFVLDTGNGTSGTLRFFVRNAAGTVSAAGSTNQIANTIPWHHVVGVCDEAGGHVYLYLDGNQVASATIAAGSGLLASTTPLSIGARQSGNNGNTNYDFQFYGNIDDVALYGKALSAAQVLKHYSQSGMSPVITGLTPSSTWTTNQGGNPTFTVAVGGTTPFTYQWLDIGGNPIAWATNSTITLTNVQPGQAGSYTVNVSNPYGGPVSTNFNLTVTQAPQLISDITPSNATVYATSPITLSVSASGTLPLIYQWYQNGALIPNATNASYSFAALSGTDTYYVTITNSYSAGTPLVSSTATIIGMPATTLSPANYTDHMTITFAGYTRAETLHDFPVLVNFGTNLPGFRYSHFASPSGADLRFTDSSGTRVIPSEIDQWNPSGVSEVWVQVPALSATNTSIVAYWGNPSATTALPGTNVWVPQSWEGLPAFDVVYHLKESGFPYADSTGQNPAVSGTAPSPVMGIVGTGEGFTNSVLNTGVINVGNAFTLSAWVNISSNANNIQGIWANKAGGNSSGFGLFVNAYQTSNQELILETGNGAGQTPTLATPVGSVSSNTWHLVTAAIDRADAVAQLYVDGVPLSTSGSIRPDFATNISVNLGELASGGFPYNGFIDEARIQAGTNSPNWVWASWMTVQQNASLATYSGITSTVTNPVSINVLYNTSTGLTLSGTGGKPNGAYSVIGATNLTQVVWPVLYTTNFDASGNFYITVPVDPAKPTQFLRIVE